MLKGPYCTLEVSIEQFRVESVTHRICCSVSSSRRTGSPAWSSEQDKALNAKRSAGVAPEVNLRIPLHTNNEAHKRGDPPWL